MAGTRSLLIGARIDQAGASHNCQRDESHRIVKGQRRLKVRKGRSWEHYCLDCAKAIVSRDTIKLQDLVRAIEEAATTTRN